MAPVYLATMAQLKEACDYRTYLHFIRLVMKQSKFEHRKEREYFQSLKQEKDSDLIQDIIFKLFEQEYDSVKDKNELLKYFLQLDPAKTADFLCSQHKRDIKILRSLVNLCVQIMKDNYDEQKS